MEKFEGLEGKIMKETQELIERELIYNKLVRDNIPYIIRGQGKKAITHIATEEDYKHHLGKKISEEVAEFLETPNEEELADILEVINSLIVVYGFSLERVLELQQNKAAQHGGFNARVILEKVVEAV